MQQVITFEYRYTENCSNYLNVFRVPYKYSGSARIVRRSGAARAEPLCLPGRIGFCSTHALNSGAALNVAATRKSVTKLIAKRELEFAGALPVRDNETLSRPQSLGEQPGTILLIPTRSCRDQQLPVPAQPIEYEACTYRISPEKCHQLLEITASQRQSRCT